MFKLPGTFFNYCFQLIILSLFLLPWRRMQFSLTIETKNKVKIDKLTNFLLYTNAFSFVVLLSIFLLVINTATDYTSFKNEEAPSFIRNLPIGSVVYLVLLYLATGSYFLLPLSFYYIMINNKKKSFFCFLFSLNLPLSGLVNLSRSSSSLFLLLCIFSYLMFRNSLTSNQKRQFNYVFLIVGIIMVLTFTNITLNRFQDTNYYDRAMSNQNIIHETATYSIVDYYSQWYKNSNDVIDLYKFKTFGGQLSFPLLGLVSEKLGIISDFNLQKKMTVYRMWPNNYYTFNGLVSNLLFDFGYIGTVLFALIYYFFVKKLSPIKRVINIEQLLVLTVLVILPMTSIFNSWMNVSSYNFVLIYAWIIYTYLKLKTK